MASVVQRVLVVGGGFSGMSAAIELRKRGVDVDLVEIDPHWRNYGAGISLGGATLRAFRQLGILDEFLAQGCATDNVEIRLPHGPVVATLPTPRIAGPDVPGGGAIMRPVLARILADATRAAGVNVRLGTTFTEIDGRPEHVEVSFTDGQRSRYDLVIGADGLHSKVRQTVFPDAPKPRYTGQAVWRAVVARSPDIKTVTMWPGPTIKPGVNPVSETEMYVFITEPRPASGEHIPPEELAPRMRALLDGFPDPVLQGVRAQLGAGSQIVFRPIDSLLVPQPWFRGRVVLIGDTVHATTPHLAAGACIGIEDALVLAEELERASEVEGALVAFQDRRWSRCRMVVENSARLGEIEVSGGDKDEHSRLIRESLMALAQTI
jgi:2-polyprenyl-6-methoxyphenol hydroxylase-like FAD-dependent oxidoreductase